MVSLISVIRMSNKNFLFVIYFMKILIMLFKVIIAIVGIIETPIFFKI